jgi:hypothetical protein
MIEPTTSSSVEVVAVRRKTVKVVGEIEVETDVDVSISDVLVKVRVPA